MKTLRIYLIPISLVISALPMTGCKSVYSTYSGPPEISASKASSISINQKIPVEPGKTRVFIQDGKFVDTINHYKTNCNIEIRKRDDNNWQYIEASQYKITGSQSTEEHIVKRKTFKPVLLAFNSTLQGSDFLLANALDDGEQSDIYLGIHYYLSGRDKNVMRLSCRSPSASPQDATYPTHDEMISTLGEVISLKLE